MDYDIIVHIIIMIIYNSMGSNVLKHTSDTLLLEQLNTDPVAPGPASV